MHTSPVTPGRFFAAVGKALCTLLLFLGCQVLVGMVYALSAAVYLGVQVGFADPMALAGQITAFIMHYSGQITLLSDLAALLVLALFFLLRKKNPLKGVGLTPCPPFLLLSAAAAAPVLYLLVSCALALLPQAWLDAYTDAYSSLIGTGFFAALATVLAAPVAEEVIFRGYILSRLRRGMPDWAALLVSAAIFGICHGQPLWMAYAFVLGLLFGLMALRTGSILPSLIAHLVFNAMGELFSLLPESFTDSEWFLILPAALCVIVWSCRKGIAQLFLPQKTKENP